MLLLLTEFLQWTKQGRFKIRDRSTGRIITFTPNGAQIKFMAEAIRQAKLRKPIRIMVPKSRKRGISTVVQLWGVFLVKRVPNYNALTAAHRADDAQEIFSIAHRAYKHLEGSQAKKGSRREIAYEQHDSKYRCMTAMGRFVASGSDTHLLHVSEAAKIENKSDQDAEAVISMVNSVPQNNPLTFIVLESSGQGPMGSFPKMCLAAEKGQGSYGLVFISWLEDPDLCVPDNSPLDPPPNLYETGLVKDCKATPGQLRWRRNEIANYYPEWMNANGTIKEGNPPRFGWEFPAYLQESFSTVEGAVYPMFSPSRHCREMKIEPAWQRYRSIDWGWSGKHAFVCLWIAHNPDAPPGLVIDPSCHNLIKQLQAYSNDPRTGRPKDGDDDGADSMRYAITTAKMRGLVYIYREMFLYDANRIGPGAVCRKIHDLSGWTMPVEADQTDIGQYRPGPTGETYTMTIADRRNNAGLIEQFSESWAMPTVPAQRPTTHANSRGEIDDGIQEVTVLMSGDTSFYTTRPDVERVKLLNAYEKKRKDIDLTDEEAETIRNDTVPISSKAPNFTPGGCYLLE